MRPARELVDEFIEDLATGAIDSKVLQYLDARGSQYQPAEVGRVGGLLADIENYRMEKDEARKDAYANDVLRDILIFRLVGLLPTNNAQKHVEMLKDEIQTLHATNEDLTTQLASAMETIKKLKSELSVGGQMFK